METSEEQEKPSLHDENIRLRLMFQDFESRVELKRHLSPVLVSALLKNLPMGTFAYPSPSAIFIKVNLKIGGRSRIGELSPGDIFYDVAQDSVGLALKSLKASVRQLKLGKISSGMEMMCKIEGIKPVKILQA